MKVDPCRLRLYAVTDRAWLNGGRLADAVAAALDGGATFVQLREKALDPADLLAEARELAALCHARHVPFVVDDNVEIALAAGADGVHVGIDDAPVAEIRRRVPADFIIGATCKTPEQALAAQSSGADYMGVGAVFPSPTKTNAIRITNEQLRGIVSAVSIPAVAIGGISPCNVSELAGSGVSGIAVVSAIFGAADIEAAASRLKEQAKAVAAV